ncbi:MAG: WecB/TagA/CpsF family glycosyltransferase [Actinomycetota bacterium]
MTAVDGNRFDVLGVTIDAMTPQSAIAFVRERITLRQKATVIFCTVSSVLTARKDPLVKRAFDEAALINPDGMPLVWLGRRSGCDVQRVYGPDFMLDLIAATGGTYRHYFYGGLPGVATETAVKLKMRFPELTVVGSRSPALGLDPVSPDPEDIAQINAAKPDIVWVGLGHPKQELWIHHNQHKIDAPVLAAVGAAFDFHAGRIKEAPGWMKRNGLQWIHRLFSDPRRLWRRYLVGNPTFVALLIKERLSDMRRDR